jgi:hypothetical protein
MEGTWLSQRRASATADISAVLLDPCSAPKYNFDCLSVITHPHSSVRNRTPSAPPPPKSFLGFPSRITTPQPAGLFVLPITCALFLQAPSV